MKSWTLTTWRKDEQALSVRGEKWRHLPNRCASWRHPGACARQRAAEDIQRIDTAIKARPADWVYIVLTFDRRAFGGDTDKAYRAIVACWGALRKRAAREFASPGDPLNYILVVERHKSGWPHVNVLLHNRRLAGLSEGTGWKRVRSTWLRKHAMACGFGFVTWLEPVKDYKAMSTYIVKLAGEMGKSCQVPMNAPRHFRRLRSSPGLLPPRPKNPEITGRLVRKEVEEVEQWDLSPFPAYQGKPTLLDVAEPGGDPWREYCDVVEPEPGCRVVQRPYTREVLWISYSFSSRESRAGPSAAPPGPSPPVEGRCSSSGGALARQLDLPWDSVEASAWAWAGAYHEEGD
jgi:hypothetical protein